MRRVRLYRALGSDVAWGLAWYALMLPLCWLLGLGVARWISLPANAGCADTPFAGTGSCRGAGSGGPKPIDGLAQFCAAALAAACA